MKKFDGIGDLADLLRRRQQSDIRHWSTIERHSLICAVTAIHRASSLKDKVQIRRWRNLVPESVPKTPQQFVQAWRRGVGLPPQPISWSVQETRTFVELLLADLGRRQGQFRQAQAAAKVGVVSYNPNSLRSAVEEPNSKLGLYLWHECQKSVVCMQESSITDAEANLLSQKLPNAAV